MKKRMITMLLVFGMLVSSCVAYRGKLDIFSRNEVSQSEKSSNNADVESDLIMEGCTEGKGRKIFRVLPKEEEKKWNLEMINADSSKMTTKESSSIIKVAVLDSGIDFCEDIDVYERKNFIPGEENVSPLYEDGSGHGTSVAGIIAAKENDIGITGVADNVKLYSAKVLDENNQAPLGRVVEAINWAIEKNVNIINMSLGISTYSKILHNAIKEATDRGILVVCAAGNGGEVEYPAAFPETIAVGSVNPDGTISENSSVGKEIDVVAPGEQIVSVTAFDGVIATGGTSMAAPHVTGIAARLWGKNESMSADFIRTLICDSARTLGDEKYYGNGVVDMEYALKNMDEAWEKYKEETDKDDMWNSRSVVEENRDDIACFEEISIVEGRWSGNIHADFIVQSTFSDKELKIIKIGAKLPDNQAKYGINGKGKHPEFHGYYSKNNLTSYTNYIGYYYLLTKMALSYASGDYEDPSKPSWVKDSDNFAELCKAVGGGIGLGTSKQSWSAILKGYTVNARNKSLVLYGMAIHEATDAFSHSAVVGGERISNTDGDSTTAKDGKYRLAGAKYVAKKMLTHIKNKTRGYVSDFAVPASVTGNKFKLAYISKMASDINATTYKKNKSAFDAMNADSFYRWDEKID